jgi:CHAT domain-containing protein
VNPVYGHLAPDELDSEAMAAGSLAQEAARHLAACEACLAEVGRRRRVQDQIISLRSGATPAGSGPCPGEELWGQFVSGSISDADATALVEHAATCDRCGHVLAELKNTGEGDESEPGVMALNSSAAGWQRSMAVRMAAASGPHRGFRLSGLLPWAAAVLIAAVATALWLARPWRESPPQALLAQAYSAHRTMELRFPGAAHAPWDQTRGALDGSHMDLPRPLIESEARIARELERRPDDPAWLDAKARAELLQWKPLAARASLERALERAPGSALLLNDLGMSWFESAVQKGQDGGAADYGKAAELFGAVLQKQPDDAVALFNRALTYEKLLLFHEALADWNRLIRIEPQGGWAEEVQKHRNDILQKLQIPPRASRDTGIEPDDPVLFTHLADAFRGGSERIQQTPAWLPATAADLAVRHADRWLANLLAGPPTQVYCIAIQRLCSAVQLNQTGDPARAESEARQALSGFQIAGSTSGVLRARFEIVYALQRSSSAQACLHQARALEATAAQPGFPWLHAQALLEISSCSNMLGEFAAAEATAARAVQEAGDHHFGILRLRALGIQAGTLTAMGRRKEALEQNRRGLEAFWAGDYPPMRAYQFYDDMSTSAEQAGDLFLARALTREAVLQIARTANRSGEAMSHYKLGRLALACGDAAEAREQFSASETLFASQPLSDAISLYRASGEIGLSRAEVRRGDPQRALERLKAVEKSLPSFSNQIVAVWYFQALTEIEQALGRRERSEEALRALVAVAEKGLASMTEDRNRLVWARELDGAYRGLVRLEIDRGQPAAALDLWEWYRGADARRREGRGQPIQNLGITDLSKAPAVPAAGRVEVLARSLNHQTVAAYAQMSDGVAAWSYDGRSMVYRWLPLERVALERLARRFAELCAQRDSTLEEVRAAGRPLYASLVAPFASSWPPGQSLLLELDGPATLVPFEALPLPDGNWLGERFHVTVSPGIYYRLATPLVGLSGRSVVVGDPLLDPASAASFPPLPDAIAEAGEVAAAFPGAVLLTGSRATVQGVRQAIPGASLFHFAGHAISTAEQSGLLLAPDANTGAGFWSARDLAPGNLRHCRLAVLSACSTGEMGPGGLSEPDSLARAFLAAGVQHVIASRWPVDSSVTRELMARFYSELKRGQSVTAALSAASKTLRERPETAHPRFWAAFTVFGAS